MDGKPVPKGGEVPVKPGTVVRVAKVMTLTFFRIGAGSPGESADATMAVI